MYLLALLSITRYGIKFCVVLLNTVVVRGGGMLWRRGKDRNNTGATGVGLAKEGESVAEKKRVRKKS